jgi:L-fuconolactonase
VAEQIAALRACPGGQTLVGIRHQVQLEPDPRWLCRDEVRAGLAELGRCGLAYDLVVTPDQLPGVIETVRALPEVRFVLDHGGKPPIVDGVIEPWRSLLAELAQLPNVAVKLSGLVTEAGAGWTVEQLQPYADLLVEAFGPERTMFGSDWPVCLLNASYDEVIDAAEQLSAGLSVTERNAVFGDTAAHWYRITP